jgi:hypothetical protein
MQDVPVHIDASIQESPIEGGITIGRLMAEAMPSGYRATINAIYRGRPPRRRTFGVI